VGSLVEIDVEVVGDHVVQVRVEGELDLAGAPELEDRLKAEISAGNEVVLDLSKLAFIDCSGLRAILSAAHKARENGGNLRRTVALSPQVRRVIEFASARATLEVTPD
jgi:anti-anti-sigma factor